jgi:GNAT superfamily N-acetyltransferase
VNPLITIRRSHRDDYAVMREIRLAALADEPDAYGSTFAEQSRFSDERWRQMAGEQNYFLALDDDHAVGMASGGRYPPRPTTRWLYGMYVEPEHRGTDVARRLVSVVANWARAEGVDTLGLHVTESVGRARRFYEKVGFTVVGEPEPMQRDSSLLLLTMLTDLNTNDLV